ncbi:MAG: type II/IV secretion system protein, partial [Sulfurovaceae bacterium]|nr:type II/IV secretion system protein [Sulfurovaceae bacterium]
MRIPFIENIDLEPIWSEEIDNILAMKHNLLFASVQDEKCAIVEKETLPMALNYLSKLDIDNPIIEVDIDSFKRLQNKFLEIKTGSDFDSISTESSDDIIEVESDLLDFIRNSQDLLSNEESAPVVKLVNSLFFQAIRKGASDIHIET